LKFLGEKTVRETDNLKDLGRDGRTTLNMSYTNNTGEIKPARESPVDNSCEHRNELIKGEELDD
jgi:hypothetical protein